MSAQKRQSAFCKPKNDEDMQAQALGESQPPHERCFKWGWMPTHFGHALDAKTVFDCEYFLPLVEKRIQDLVFQTRP
jgi:hypothetical protein